MFINHVFFSLNEKPIKPAINKIIWTLETTALLSEPGIIAEEGELKLETETAEVAGLEEGKYRTKIWLEYSNVNMVLIDVSQVLMGRYSLIIRNKGSAPSGNIVIEFKEQA